MFEKVGLLQMSGVICATVTWRSNYCPKTLKREPVALEKWLCLQQPQFPRVYVVVKIPNALKVVLEYKCMASLT